MRQAWVGMVIAALVCGSGMAMAAEEKPSGTVSMESKSVAIGVGVSWGDGKLRYKGKTHTFSVKGLSVIDLGVSKVSARGKVYHLNKVEDFSGTYAAAQAGAAVGGGMSVVALKNENGVVMELSSTQTGVKLTLAGEGIEIKLK
ncbi:MAG TPA: EipA family protein [Methylomirabilota bacterium]